MSYGSTALASTAIAGLSASAGTLYSPSETLAEGVHRRTLEYTGDAEWFQIETRMESEPQVEQRIVRIYTHNDPAEVPQLQVAVGGDAFYTQSIIGAARFIVVDLEMLIEASETGITITGNEYFQNN
jgi:hypothetical protein